MFSSMWIQSGVKCQEISANNEKGDSSKSKTLNLHIFLKHQNTRNEIFLVCTGLELIYLNLLGNKLKFNQILR